MHRWYTHRNCFSFAKLYFNNGFHSLGIKTIFRCARMSCASWALSELNLALLWEYTPAGSNQLCIHCVPVFRAKWYDDSFVEWFSFFSLSLSLSSFLNWTNSFVNKNSHLFDAMIPFIDFGQFHWNWGLIYRKIHGFNY